MKVGIYRVATRIASTPPGSLGSFFVAAPNLGEALSLALRVATEHETVVGIQSHLGMECLWADVAEGQSAYLYRVEASELFLGSRTLVHDHDVLVLAQSVSSALKYAESCYQVESVGKVMHVRAATSGHVVENQPDFKEVYDQLRTVIKAGLKLDAEKVTAEEALRAMAAEYNQMSYHARSYNDKISRQLRAAELELCEAKEEVARLKAKLREMESELAEADVRRAE